MRSCQTLFGPQGQNRVWQETCWKVCDYRDWWVFQYLEGLTTESKLADLEDSVTVWRGRALCPSVGSHWGAECCWPLCSVYTVQLGKKTKERKSAHSSRKLDGCQLNWHWCQEIVKVVFLWFGENWKPILARITLTRNISVSSWEECRTWNFSCTKPHGERFSWYICTRRILEIFLSQRVSNAGCV